MIIMIADEAEITASTNVLLIYMSKQRLFCMPCSCSKRSYPELAHPRRAAYNWQSGNKIIVHKLPVKLYMLS